MPVYNMPSGKPYIGCKLGLISKAQNRYEGILYTIDTINSAVVLENVKCFGTEGRPTAKPVPPKHGLFEYITFRGSDIKDITVCEPPRPHQILPNDPAIIQSGGIWSGHHTQQGRPLTPVRMPSYNPLASSFQYDPAHGFVLPGQLVRRALTVEKAVQTTPQRRELPPSGDQGWEAWRSQAARAMAPRGPRPPKRNPAPVSRPHEKAYRGRSGYYYEAGPPPRRGQGRRKNNGPGWQMADYAASSTLTFETDFDFDTSNAQFIKEVLEGELRYWVNAKEGHSEGDGNAEQDSQADKNQQDPIGPKCNYDKEKSFFDKLSSENAYRPTWAEERRRNIETFGVPGLFPRARGYRGGYRGGYQGGYRGMRTPMFRRAGNEVF